MRLFSSDQLTLAVLVAAIAGMVDVVAFVALGGFFASFMSGNSTRLAISATANWFDLQLAASLIAAFIVGVTLTTVLRHRHPARAQAVTLTLVAGLLAIAALFADFDTVWPMLLLAAAMGGVNLLFEEEGGVRVGLTYMSGTLVRLGQALAGLLTGRRTADWHGPLLLWGAFIGGGLTGVGLYARFGLPTLWVPAALAAALSVLAWRSIQRAAGDVLQPDSAQEHAALDNQE
jgi:uncharacterized membrane protein YoaK (UPF0700 family)